MLLNTPTDRLGIFLLHIVLRPDFEAGLNRDILMTRKMTNQYDRSNDLQEYVSNYELSLTRSAPDCASAAQFLLLVALSDRRLCSNEAP